MWSHRVRDFPILHGDSRIGNRGRGCGLGVQSCTEERPLAHLEKYHSRNEIAGVVLRMIWVGLVLHGILPQHTMSDNNTHRTEAYKP